MGGAERRSGTDATIQPPVRRQRSSIADPFVYVVEDDVSVREALRNLLRSVGLNVETFSSAEEFLSRGCSGPGCLILDVRLRGLSGLDLQRRLAENHCAIPIVFITGHGDIQMSVKAIKAGAIEFLTKPFRDQDLLDAVRQAMERDRQTRSHENEIAELRERYESLTPREQEAMKHVVYGLANKQIGAQMGITDPTVKLHRGRLMHKMGAGSLADLIRMAEKLALFGSLENAQELRR